MGVIASVGTGTSGTLEITDDGSTVQAVIVNTNGATHVAALGWSLTIGSGSASGTVAISGAGTYIVWSSGWGPPTVSMTFNMASSGTSGLGGPTSVGATINRSTVPSVVRSVTVTNIGPTSAQVNFTAPASNGGSALISYLIRISKNNPANVAPYTDKVGNSGTVLTGLTPATQYYVTVYALNGVGYSPLSPSVAVKTLGIGRVRVAGVWTNATPYVRVGGVWVQATPYIKVAGVWIPAT